MKSCAKNKVFQAHITCVKRDVTDGELAAACRICRSVDWLQQQQVFLYLLSCLHDLYPLRSNFGLCSFTTGFNTPDSYGRRAITRIFLATVYISPWQLSKEGLCMAACIGTATSTSYAERNGRLGLGRMLTDWNAETFFMVENSLSDVTLINSFTILLSQWRVPRFRKINYCMLTKLIIGL